jgi:pullulanase
MRKINRFEAHLDDYGIITAYLSKEFYQGRSDVFYVRDSYGQLSKCSIYNYEHSGNEYYKYTLGCDTNLIIGDNYDVLEEHGLTVPLQYSLITKALRFDEEFYYDGDDLGVICTDDACEFAIWAPTANRIVVEIFKSQGPYVVELKRSDKGVFRSHVDFNGHGLSYLYHIHVNGVWNTAIDPMGMGSTVNNQRSVIIDYNQIKPLVDYKLSPLKQATDSIIYELSVRDFTMQAESNVKNRGQFLGLTEENTKTLGGVTTGLAHIKELGITHVQIMPMYDFATVDEHNVSLFYNWGYDPVQFNVPEGSYSSNPDSPINRIEEARSMVDSFHKNDIRVVMDVVYNHVYDMEASSFEQVVPYYFFRRSNTGALSNGSFCGNDFDSNRKMARKYILDSIKHWMTYYDVDGFRFDLMGVLDVETMNQVEKLCRSIKPESLVYGEGWNMPTSLPENLKANRYNQHLMPNIGHFNDFFREHVKGRTAHEEVNVKGYCAGDTNYIEAMKACMLGTSVANYTRLFDKPTQSINYIECHDNHTVWDKMKESNKEDNREVRIKRQKLMLGSILLAQGIPFIHSGQEFCRTKNGLHNTYRSPDTVNQMDWARKDRYIEVFKYTKDMIKLRKMFPIFRLTSSEMIEKHVKFKEFDGMLIVNYKCQKTNPYTEIWIYINPTNQIYYESFSSFVKIIANEAGLIDGVLVQNATINPYTLVVFANAEAKTE